MTIIEKIEATENIDELNALGEHRFTCDGGSAPSIPDWVTEDEIQLEIDTREQHQIDEDTGQKIQAFVPIEVTVGKVTWSTGAWIDVGGGAEEDHYAPSHLMGQFLPDAAEKQWDADKDAAINVSF